MQQLNLFKRQESLEMLNKQIRNCENCNLSTTRKHALTGEGCIDAKILFIALSPGAKEDVEHKMFIGPSGKVFNRLLQHAAIDRSSVYITNLIKCKLPNNRKPKQYEIEACSTYLDKEIAIICPQVIVPLGYFATKAVLSKFNIDSSISDISFKNINGKLIQVGETKIFPITHPSALLYNPSFEPETQEKYNQLQSFL